MHRGLVAQLLVAPAVFRAFGVQRALFVFPALVFLAAGGVVATAAVGGLLVAVMALKGIDGVLRSSRSGKEWKFTGEVLDNSLIPLRNRRQDPDGNELFTRITEAMTRFECRGEKGIGMSEYLDQIVDGQPIGDDVR